VTTSARVDIGIPTKDWRRAGRPIHLREAIASVLGQTFGDWRLTVSENDVEPHLSDVLDPYLADERIRHVTTGAAVTGAANSSALLAAAEAPYVAILHDDDRWDPEFLARRVAFLDAHPECGFVFGQHRLIDEDGRLIWLSRPSLPAGVHASRDYVPLLIRYHRKPQPPTALVRLDAYRAVGAAFDDRFPGWDYEMWIRLGARFPCGFLAEWDSDYRVHAASAGRSERWGRRWVELQDHIEGIVDRDLPGLFPAGERAQQRAVAFLRAAVDEAEGGRRREASALLAAAAREHPSALASARTLVILLAVAGGPAAQHAVTRLRGTTRQLRARRSVARWRASLRRGRHPRAATPEKPPGALPGARNSAHLTRTLHP
jgi:hypothetical protein